MFNIRRTVTSSSIGKSNFLSSLTVYGFPLSQPTRAVLLLLKANKVNYDFILVDALKGENRKPDIKKLLHPAGLVPTIKQGDFVLGESGAILQYLAEFYGLSLWSPTDVEAKAKVNFWLHWNHTGTRNATKGVLVYALFPMLVKKDPSAPVKGLKGFTSSITFLESQLKENGTPFIVGHNPTIADLQIITELDQLEAFHLFDYSPYPHVSQWITTLRGALGEAYEEVYAGVLDAAAGKK